MFPIRDHNPSTTRPFVTWALMAINVTIFLGNASLGDQALAQIYHDFGIIPAQLSSGQGYGTLVSSMFLHGGILHLAGNMLFLWIFGDNLEDAMGHVGYLAFYLACGIGAGLAQVAAAPQSMVPVIGASGAIAGVMGGYLLLYPRARVDILVILIFIIRIVSVPAWAMLGLWFGFQLIGGVASDSTGGGVAHWAHAGGFLLGLIFCLPIWLRRGGRTSWRENSGRPPHPEAEYSFKKTPIPHVSLRGHRNRLRGPWD